MPRRRGRVDDNQPDIVEGLRRCGCFVHSLADIGGGCPDLLVGFQRRTILLEVKDGRKPPSERQLTPDEKKWHRAWKDKGGELYVVESLHGALKAVGLEIDFTPGRVGPGASSA